MFEHSSPLMTNI